LRQGQESSQIGLKPAWIMRHKLLKQKQPVLERRLCGQRLNAPRSARGTPG